MYDKEEVIVSPRIFEGKTDQEIIEWCKKYLGDRHPDYLHFPKALAQGMREQDYADRLRDIDRGIDYKNPQILDLATRRELGVNGGPGESISTLARAAMNEEALAVRDRGLRGETFRETVDEEELIRRVGLIHDFCPEQLGAFAHNALFQWIYVQPLEEIEAAYKGNTKSLVEDLNVYIPPFFKMVEIFIERGIDIDKVQMAPGKTVKDVYNIVKEKFSKYIKDGRIVDPNENKEELDHQQTQETNQEISQMIEEDVSPTLSQEEIQRQIDENNRQIMELMERNNKLVAQLAQKAKKSQEQSMRLEK